MKNKNFENLTLNLHEILLLSDVNLNDLYRINKNLVDLMSVISDNAQTKDDYTVLKYLDKTLNYVVKLIVEDRKAVLKSVW